MRSKRDIIIAVLAAYIDNKDFAHERLKAQEELTYHQQQSLNEIIALVPNVNDHYEVFYKLLLRSLSNKRNAEEIKRQILRGDEGNLEKTLKCLEEIIGKKEREMNEEGPL